MTDITGRMYEEHVRRLITSWAKMLKEEGGKTRVINALSSFLDGINRDCQVEFKGAMQGGDLRYLECFSNTPTKNGDFFATLNGMLYYMIGNAESEDEVMWYIRKMKASLNYELYLAGVPAEDLPD